jgi:hypothetical protein
VLVLVVAFNAIAFLTLVQLLILKTCRMYNVFGSGANHAIYAQFIGQSSAANSGRKIGLLRGAGTRMASWFYGMMRLLRLKQPLKATIHQSQFRELNLNASAKAAVHDIEDEKFWKSLYVLLRAVYPALRALRYCDCNTPVMDKIYFLSHRSTDAIARSQEHFDEVGLFSADGLADADMGAEVNQIYEGEIGDNTAYVDDDNESVGEGEDVAEGGESDDDSDSTGAYGGFPFGSKILWHWERRKVKLEHEYAITAWALCVMEDVREDVRVRLTGAHRMPMETVVKRLHLPPCPNQNLEVRSMSEAQIIDVFWDEFMAFRNCTPPFHERSRWATLDVQAGRSHLWHEKYSLPYTKVLGFVACRVTSKLGGIGPAERSWGAVKQIKDGKRSHIGSDSLEKRAIVFMSAKMREARIANQHLEKVDAGPNAMFRDDDINFDLQLEKFGVDIAQMKQPVKRVFRAWVEEWEEEDRKKNDCVAEARILAKYKNLAFNDPDTGGTFSIWEKNMEFRRGRGNGWMLIATCADDDVDDEAFTLEIACELIGNTPQEAGVEVIHKEGEQ